MIWRVLRQTALVLTALVILLVAGCALLTDARFVVLPAPSRLPSDSEPARPPLLAPGYGQDALVTVHEWNSRRRPALLSLFQSDIYGAVPEAVTVHVDRVDLIDETAFDGLGRLENWTVILGTPDGPVELDLAVVLPHDIQGPVPVFLVPNECGNRHALQADTLPAPIAHTMSWCDASPNGLEAALTTAFFGEYVLSPPAARILERGYGLAAYHESQIAPDSASLAEPILVALTPPGTPEDQRTGTLAAWSWGLSHAVKALKSDLRVGPVALMGHSRRGKAVLLAAALDPGIDLVVSHQSGTGGAALSRRETGETVGDVVESYPHWFAPAFADYAGRTGALPVDQHQLLALIAPRPVLLGNSSRDRWSDPVGTLLAANAAAPAWGLHGEPIFEQSRLDVFEPDQPLAFYMRGGTHGVTGEDWETFLDFADAQLAGRGPE